MYFCVKSNVYLLVIWQFKMELTQHQFSTSFPAVRTGVQLVKTRVLFAGYISQIGYKFLNSINSRSIGLNVEERYDVACTMQALYCKSG